MNKYFLFLSMVSLLFFACKKGPGVGGRATVKGKVYARNLSNVFIQNDSGYVGGQKVYIQYGTETGVSDNVETDYSGEYTFSYLRPGSYTIYCYSKQKINNQLDSVVKRTIEVSSKKEVLEVPQIDIFTQKN